MCKIAGFYTGYKATLVFLSFHFIRGTIEKKFLILCLTLCFANAFFAVNSYEHYGQKKLLQNKF